ncbi:hypothetical protein OG218_01370 [Kineococcus sp. NBC_00420]|uniref:hypothetical protein n=1 Tax=Kineococcus sp. NBC_00420 TaxID=2903564 RepID=UPI002E1A1BCB
MIGPLHLTGWSDTVEHAGSLYAVQPAQRHAAAQQLAEAGWWIHVDIIVPGEGPLLGVGLDELAAVAQDLPEAKVEVHIVDLVGTDRVAAVLDQVLSIGADRLVLPSAWCLREGNRVKAHGVQLWAELNRTPLPEYVFADGVVDGVLVMLIEPGTTQSIDLNRLSAVADLPTDCTIGVDGGVGPHHEAECRAAGVEHLVSGRALLARPTSSPSIQSQPTRRGTEESRR